MALVLRSPHLDAERMKELSAFHCHGVPLLLGTSRKSFIGKTLGIDNPEDRVWGTAATVAMGIMAGVHVIRAHDIKPMRQVMDMTTAIISESSGS